MQKREGGRFAPFPSHNRQPIKLVASTHETSSAAIAPPNFLAALAGAIIVTVAVAAALLTVLLHLAAMLAMRLLLSTVAMMRLWTWAVSNMRLVAVAIASARYIGGGATLALVFVVDHRTDDCDTGDGGEGTCDILIVGTGRYSRHPGHCKRRGKDE